MQEDKTTAPVYATIAFVEGSGLKEEQNRVVIRSLGTGFAPGTAVKMVANITKAGRDQYESFLADGVHRVDDNGQIASELAFTFAPDAKLYYDFGISVRAVGVCNTKQQMVIVETPLMVLEVPGNM